MNTTWKYFIFVFTFIYATDGEKFRCDYFYSHFAQAWFKYHVVPLTWQDARLMCHLQGAILASPTTREIKTVMANYSGVHEIFTGFHSTFSKGNYYTVDGIPLDEVPHEWADYNPSNSHDKQDCLIINSLGQLSDVDCSFPRPFMCYKKKVDAVNVCGTPDPEYRLDSRTNKCYKFHTVPRQFKRAHFACSAEGGHLAIINSDEEAKVLRELFAKYPAHTMIGNFWKDVAFIGFHDWDEHGDWRTIHGQTLQEAGYAKFSPGEPNNSTAGEYCGSIYRTALLNDLWCEKHFAFICEKRPDFPAVCSNEKPFDPIDPRAFEVSENEEQGSSNDTTLDENDS
ncbi:uncharacterized protein LOC142983722 [Anticarsia gemmatalis]|uniref:uncharacterized protein LOC142983722 n=1 Tax=Anticarsia gemmatalis TaxID=129554 RepID=UPI003F765B7D